MVTGVTDQLTSAVVHLHHHYTPEMPTNLPPQRGEWAAADQQHSHRKVLAASAERYLGALCPCTAICDTNLDRIRGEPATLRLSVSQVVIAINHVRDGGTMVVLIHRPEA
ncbi:hypothetical protein CONLIGDRAFT_650616 [Coniochaeta ligniaria NRRL 30616]|uniref:Uncharacterized protein n=1 Tax=Coniochaeta ligniaria NRRL 30616 TaxID=1408157 RepID=A0A1J7J4F1_9PEZI|nr:hypothetical protein CONLIGDRAFT_650616 [Coniochaeta ligniaria NRRL 30616]